MGANEKHLLNNGLTWAMIFILLTTAWIRWGLLDVPLERDEGEFAYAGQLILQGVPPYQLLYNMKLPGIYAAYAGVMALFGQTPRGIHLGLLIVNGLSILLVFFLAKKLMDPIAGIVASGCFAVLSMSQSVQGVFANAEHFVVLPALAGLLLLLQGLEKKRRSIIFFSGLLLGIGFIVKQHGAAFIVLGGLYLIYDQLKTKPLDLKSLFMQCLLFGFGAVLPYGLTCLILFWAGVFDKFWFLTVQYAGAYTSVIPIEYAWPKFKASMADIVRFNPLVFLLSFLGFILIWFEKTSRKKSAFLILFLLFSFAAICPGFYFRPHYFVLTLPVIAISAGMAISVTSKKMHQSGSRVAGYGLPLIAAVICLIFSVYQQRTFLFERSPIQACRSTYGLNPFPESVEIGRYIQQNTTPDDKIAVIGSEPQIYFYSNRHSATGYIYMYGLMEPHDFSLQMQQEMIQEIESNKPKFLIYINIPASWLMRPDSHKEITQWFSRYHSYYTLAGTVELFKETSQYHWAPNLVWPPRSPLWIGLLKRK